MGMQESVTNKHHQDDKYSITYTNEMNIQKESSQTHTQHNLAAESDSEDEAVLSRVGNIPFEWYDNEEHIGYDIYGNPILHADKGDSIDAFLRRTDDPNAMYVFYLFIIIIYYLLFIFFFNCLCIYIQENNI